MLKIGTEAAFRVKMENLKIKYGGPTKNFFEQATYPEPLRFDEVNREKEFKLKRKEREVVLIKGMYE